MINNEALRVIDRLYPDFFNTDIVKHYSNKKEGNKFRRLENYFSSLEKVHDRVFDNPTYSEDRLRRLKNVYYKWCLIRKENIQNSYYENQERLALERGYGHIKMTKAQKDELAKEVIENQMTSLDSWIDYFISDDSKFYPFWAKYWAFRGMLKLGYYDTQNGMYNKRGIHTTAPFAELNHEALALSIDLFIKSVGKEEISDEDLRRIASTNSFQKIYVHFLKELSNSKTDNKEKDKGIWIKYNQGSDHLPLVESLKGRNTGWCTAGEATAKAQLSRGDFYVYYTLDGNNEYKIPRIAIRMENGSIAEIRGVSKGQNIETSMESVVEEKLKEFPDGEKYKKIVKDMKIMTEIYEKHINGIDLTQEELIFLYEIEDIIRGFGYKKDPRIEEVKEKRNIEQDYAKIYNCEESQIAFTKREIKEDTVCKIGPLSYNNKRKEKIIIPKHIIGDLNLSSFTNAESLTLPETIKGTLDLSGLTSAEGLVLPKKIYGQLKLNSLTSAKGLVFPKTIHGGLHLNSLTSAEGLILPENISGQLDLSSLTSPEYLNLPKFIGWDLYLNSLTSAKGLVFPESINGELNLSSLTSAEGLVLPKKIGQSLDLSSLTSSENLILPEDIYLALNLNSLTSAKGLKFPKRLSGGLYLGNLKSAENLILPEYVGGILNLSNLPNAKELILPKYVGFNLYLSKLTSIETLILPENVGWNVDLRNLTSVKNLQLPKKIGDKLYLNSLKDLDCLNITEPFDYSIVTSEGTFTYEELLQLKKSKNSKNL